MSVEYLTMPLQYKSVEVKKDDESVAIVEGYAAAIGNVDLGDDRIVPGAFQKTIRERKGVWPVLADHNPSKKIGVNFEAAEDNYGLKVKYELNLEVQLARERRALAKQSLRLGADAGLSIGYMPTDFGFKEEDGRQIRELKEIKMFEHSDVTFPMNESAFITAAKNWSKADTQDFIGALINMHKAEGKSEHEAVTEMEKQIAQIKQRLVGDSNDFVKGVARIKDVLQGKS